MLDRVLLAWKRSAHSGPASLEIFMAFFALNWAVLLLSPTMAGTRVVLVLSDLLPMPMWSCIFVLVAALQLWALAHGYRTRRRMAWLGVFFWGAMTGLLFSFALLLAHANTPVALTSSVQFLAMVVGYMLIVISLSAIWAGNGYDEH